MGNLEPLARTYPAGVTSWVEVALPDVGAGKEFYGGLFGWRFDGLVATLDGLDVASVGDAGSGPAAWATYVAVDDADAMAQAMVALGAELVAPPEDAGRGRTRRHPPRPAGRGDPAVAGAPAPRRPAHEQPGCVELQRPAHRRPCSGSALLRRGLRLAGGRPGLGRGDPGAGVRRPPRGHGRPRHPLAAGLRPRRLRGRHRRARAGRGRRADPLARHLHRGRPRHVGRARREARRPGAGHR